MAIQKKKRISGIERNYLVKFWEAISNNGAKPSKKKKKGKKKTFAIPPPQGRRNHRNRGTPFGFNIFYVSVILFFLHMAS